MKATRVFISYKRESASHVEKVQSIAHRLRSIGCRVVMDEFANFAGSNIKWKKWEKNNLKKADYILVILSKGYVDAWNGLQKGTGASNEAEWIKQQRLKKGVPDAKFIFAHISPEDKDHIPTGLKCHIFELWEGKPFVDIVGRLKLEEMLLEPFLIEKRAKVPAQNCLFESIRSFREELRNQAYDHARSRITSIVGRLSERFGATSAWLFLKKPSELTIPDAEIHLVRSLSHNTPRNNRAKRPFRPCDWDDMKDHSVIGYVAKTKLPYIIHKDPKSDPFYQRCQTETKSELAVPILQHTCVDEPEAVNLIGVLNLESNEECTFLDNHKGELQAAVYELTPHLLVYLACEKAEQDGKESTPDYVWHPEIFQWDICNLLDKFCGRVTANFDLKAAGAKNKEKPAPVPSCTIWYSDPISGEMYVRATSKFDYEYIDDLILANGSFTSRVVTLRNTQVVSGSPEKIKSFKRKEKAKRMGMMRVFSAPIYASLSSSAVGAISLYFFNEDRRWLERTDCDAQVASAVTFLSAEVGSIIGACLQQKEEITSALYHERMNSMAVPGINGPEILRDLILTFLCAKGCSLFALTEDVPSFQDSKRRKPDRETIPTDSHVNKRTILRCISTSNLIGRDGDPVPAEEATYDLAREADYGLTVFLAKTRLDGAGKTSIRRVSANESTEKPSIKIVNKFRESFSHTASEHRPFLGVTVHDGESVWGVIRVVRDSGGRPFSVYDENLLARIGRIACPLFRQWATRGYPGDFSRSLQLGSRYPFLSRLVRDQNARSVASCIERLGLPFPEHCRWNRRYIDSILLDLLNAMHQYGAFLASVRVEDKSGNLRFVALHSTKSRNPVAADELKLSDGHRSKLGAKCLKQGVVLAANQRSPHIHVLRHADLVRKSLCLPLCFWTDQGMVRGVLSVDFSKKVELTSSIIEVAFLASQKLMVMGRNNRWVDAPMTVEYKKNKRIHRLDAQPNKGIRWDHALPVFLQELNSTSLRRDHQRDKLFDACVIFRPKNDCVEADPWESVEAVLEATGESLLKAGPGIGRHSPEKKSIVLPLNYGYFETGLELRAILKEELPENAKAREMHLNAILGQVFHKWQKFCRIPVALGGEPFIQVHFELEQKSVFEHWRKSVSVAPMRAPRKS